MKKLFFEVLLRELPFIPVFLELRSANHIGPSNIIELILKKFDLFGVSIDRDIIEHWLKTGKMILILDGLDEISPALVKHYEREIDQFCWNYTECPIIVTSRPLYGFVPWTGFTYHKISKFTLPESIRLISTIIDYDIDLKNTFIAKLSNGLFEIFDNIAGNPLFCQIMFATFCHSGRVSRDRAEFFDDLFRTLWAEHDDTKADFLRQRFTRLDRGKFRKLFSAFAFVTYVNSIFELRKSDFDKYVSLASDITHTEASADNFIKDLVTSTSLMIEDGAFFEFIHRSVQEYFCAEFIAHSQEDLFAEFFELVLPRMQQDYVLPVLFTICEPKIQRLWIAPYLDQINQMLDIKDGEIEKYGEIIAEDYQNNNPACRIINVMRFLMDYGAGATEVRAALDADHDLAERMNFDDLMPERNRTGRARIKKIVSRDVAKYLKYDRDQMRRYFLKAKLQIEKSRLAGPSIIAKLRRAGLKM